MAVLSTPIRKVSSVISTTSSNTLRRIKMLDVQHDSPARSLTNRQTVVPIGLVSLLFCMWGLAYGLLDIMNFHIKVAMSIKREQAAILAAGYYAAYIPVPALLAGPMIKRCGYRATMVLGLAVLALGDLLMSVGANACSLPGMVGAHFVVGIGVSTLERAANPYAINCGPRSRATLRILFAQGWAGIGTVIAPFMANAFVFSDDSAGSRPARDPQDPSRCLIVKKHADSDLTSVITFYRGLAACVVGLTLLLATVFFRTRWVPEVEEPTSPDVACGWKLWKHPLCSMRYARLWWGILANFVNLGCQVTFAQFFIEHMKVNGCVSDQWAAICMSFAQLAFVVGRFAAAGLVTAPKIFKPRYVLAAFLSGAIAFCAAGTSVTSTPAIVCAVMVMFFEAPSFPMIFESATADFDKWTPTAETLMITSISGGALQPALMGKLVSSVQISNGWWLTTGAFGLVLTHALANNMIPSFRRSVDAAELESNGDEQDQDQDPNRADDLEMAPRVEVEDIALPAPVATRKYFGGQ